MFNNIQIQFERYYSSGIIVDTNILLLYFIGEYDINFIPRFKRTIQFTIEDYELLTLILRRFKRILTTPNILTEVSSLANSLKMNIKPHFFDSFSKNISMLDETYLDSKSLSKQDEFIKFGLTDIGIHQLANKKYLVLTDDFTLAQYLKKHDVPVVNFNHIRTYAWK